MMNSTQQLKEMLNEWSAVYNRRLPPEALNVWVRKFARIDARLLAEASERVLDTSDRFPVPATLRKALNSAIDHRQTPGTEYHFQQAIAKDPETGDSVPVLVDKEGTLMFQKHHCPEGREFINMLHRLKGKKSIPFPKPLTDMNQMRERQRQKLEYERLSPANCVQEKSGGPDCIPKRMSGANE